MIDVFDWSFKALIGVLALRAVILMIMDRTDHQKRDAILWVINRSPDGIYAQDICNITGVPYSQIYIALARLEDAGAVRYERDEQWPHRFRYFGPKQN